MLRCFSPEGLVHATVHKEEKFSWSLQGLPKGFRSEKVWQRIHGSQLSEGFIFSWTDVETWCGQREGSGFGALQAHSSSTSVFTNQHRENLIYSQACEKTRENGQIPIYVIYRPCNTFTFCCYYSQSRGGCTAQFCELCSRVRCDF